MEIAQGILTTCGDCLVLCFQVDDVHCQEDKQLSFVGSDLQKLLPVSLKIGKSIYPSLDSLPTLLSGMRLQAALLS